MGAYITDVLLGGISFYCLGHLIIPAYCSDRCIDVFYRGGFEYEGLVEIF
jgi:hypothetical protein